MPIYDQTYGQRRKNHPRRRVFGDVEDTFGPRYRQKIERLRRDLEVHATGWNLAAQQRDRLALALRTLLAEVRLKGHCPSDGVEPCGICRAIEGAEKALEG